MPLAVIPPATKIHAIELHPGRGAQLARAAGQSAQLVSLDGERATVKLPSGEIRFLNVDHPMGGGEGRTSGGGHPQSPWGQLSKGFPTRKKSNPTNTQILVRRNGRQFKKK